MARSVDPHIISRKLVELALRRQARGTGSSAGFLKLRTAMQPVPELSAVLQNIRWVLVDGLATRAYMPERATLDVDILIQAEDTQAARRAFARAGYTVSGTLSIGGFTAVRDAEPPVDVLALDAPWVADALAAPYTDVAGLPVLALPYLILMKLEAGRTQDFADVQRMLGQASTADRELARRHVAQFAPLLVEDFDSLIQLADLEFGSPDASAS